MYELKKLGIGSLISPENDCLSLTKKEKIKFSNNIFISAWRDHRIAMAFASCAVITGKISIDDLISSDIGHSGEER